MKITLVCMPWASLSTPSLALGILSRRIADAFPDIETETVYANIDFADWMDQKGGLGRTEYGFYSLNSYFEGCGDWVFSSALYDDPTWRVDEFTESMRDRITDEQRETSQRLHGLVPEFVDTSHGGSSPADRTSWARPRRSSRTPRALAALRRLKQTGPGHEDRHGRGQLRRSAGGARCTATSRSSTTSYGARARRTFPSSARRLRSRGRRRPVDMSRIPGLCQRVGRRQCRQPAGRTAPAARRDPVARLRRLLRPAPSVPVAVLDRAQAGRRGRARLLVGREAPLHVLRAQRVVDAVPQQEPGHLPGGAPRPRRAAPRLDFYVVDNILDMGYFDTVLAGLADASSTCGMQYEVKSNLRCRRSSGCARPGAVQVQPGIESLEHPGAADHGQGRERLPERPRPAGRARAPASR